MVARVAVVAGEHRCRVRGRVRTVGADGQPPENEKIKLPLAHEIRARAMARALLRGASAGLDPLPAGVRCSMLNQSATRARAQ